jgi:hypothetical protein
MRDAKVDHVGGVSTTPRNGAYIRPVEVKSTEVVAARRVMFGAEDDQVLVDGIDLAR